MSRNGPLALCYHALFTAFMLAPILVVCFVAFTPEGYLSFPTDRWSLRWFRAIARYPEFVSAFWRTRRYAATLGLAVAAAAPLVAAWLLALHHASPTLLHDWLAHATASRWSRFTSAGSVTSNSEPTSPLASAASTAAAWPGMATTGASGSWSSPDGSEPK